MWSDRRRANLLELTHNPDVSVSATPRHLATVQSERLYNSSTVIEANILKPVWWVVSVKNERSYK
ncbi:MAG: hypothetical protein OHK0019_33920 [Saprospiraceae bacterium]